MMAKRTLLLLCLFVFVAGFVNVRSEDTTCTCEKQITIDAILSYYDNENPNMLILCLISGDNAHVFRNYQRDAIVTTASLDLPQDDVIQAAYVPEGQPDRRIVYGKDSIYFMRYFPGQDTRLTNIRYGPARAFIEHGGPDAIGRFLGVVYVFKGCDVVIRRRWDDWSDPMKIADTFPGVPCHVDGVWEDKQDYIFFLKGDQIWIVNSFGVQGPYSASLYFTLMDGWVLKPARDTR